MLDLCKDPHVHSTLDVLLGIWSGVQRKEYGHGGCSCVG